MEYSESAYVMLSALQHYAFCPRQCALIHLEQVWADNSRTVEGTLLHENAHSGKQKTQDGVRVATALPLHSRALGLSGVADVVEFHQTGGVWLPYPVEYKRGRPQKGCDADKVQLCAQALCLEEMLGVSIPEGSLFYGQTRRRLIVAFDGSLRARTATVARSVHELMEAGKTPMPEPRPACDSCSLKEACLPELGGLNRRAQRYIRDLCEGV